MSTIKSKPVGGGFKKILYALKTINAIGVPKASKALNSKNTCKACGLGMGGQNGGMTDEQGVFPSVCNKSVQAQSTDIQPPIPEAIFDYTLDEFRKLSSMELEKIGRLGHPIYKSADSDRFKTVDWDWAMNKLSDSFSDTEPDRSFFYSSGRSSNESGFLLQLLARMYGTNNVNNCSYYCHQATGVGMSGTLGTGTATVELDDLDYCDLIFVIGANPASNHPRFIYKLKACRERGGQVIIINPAKEPGLVKFAVPKSPASLLSGGSEIATKYVQPKIGSDLYLLSGIAKSLLEKGGDKDEFISEHTDSFDELNTSLSELDWTSVVQQTGVTKEEIESIAELYRASRNSIFAWGMGVTHHKHGVENVEAIANLALLRGMVGRTGAGLLPLRGHSNVQGIGTVGVKPKLGEDSIAATMTALNVNAAKVPTKEGLDTLSCLEAAERGKIDAALFVGGNLYQATPKSAWAASALDKIKFKCHLTTTLNYSHLFGNENSEALILPVCARDEEPEPTTQESMFNFVRLSEGGIQRIANARSETKILRDLFERICRPDEKTSTKLANNRQIRETIAHSVAGMEQLETIDSSGKEFHIKNRVLHKPEFNTPSKKAVFAVHSFDLPKQDGAYPFMLASVRSEGQFNSIIYESKDTYRGTTHRWCVLMNQEDIVDLGKKPGDTVNIRSAHGDMRGVSIHEFAVPRGNVLAYYPEANVLIGLERDPRSKTPAFKSVAVAIE